MKKPRETSKAVEADITASNHAFYVGKFIPRTTRQRIVEFLTGEGDERLYSKEFYLAMLREAFDRVQEGEKVRVVLAPQLSEIFNAEEDVEKALTAEQQAKLIRALAKRYFGRDDIEVESVEDQERHQAFFETLRGAIDPETKELNTEAALGGNENFELSEEPDSLEMARYLYAAAKEHETLEMIFRHAVPKRLGENMEEDSPMQYYALAEVAIRLTDILHGIEVHGGADRQDIYDQIISRIVKGEKGSYKKIPQLQRLFELMEDRPFGTIHVRTKENPYVEKRKKRIKFTRRTVGIALGITALGLAFQQGAEHERKERERIEAMVDGSLEERLKGESFYMNGPHLKISQEQNVEVFKRIVSDCLRDIGQRYQISWSQQKKLQPLLQEYLLEHETPSAVRDNAFARFDAVDRFVKKHQIYLQSLGVEVDRPYANLMPHLEIFKKAAEKKDDYTVTRKSAKKNPPSRFGGFDTQEICDPELTKLGTFISGQSFSNFYAFYLHKGEGQTRLVARDTQEEKEKDVRAFTTQKARDGAFQFLYAMQRYDALELGMENKALSAMRYWTDFGNDSGFISPCSETRRESPVDSWIKVKPYQDSLGRFSYEFLVDSGYDREKRTSYPCLLAKADGESHFTHQRAEEMAQQYEAMKDKWFDLCRGSYYEAMIPLDTNKILSEIDEMTAKAETWKRALQGYEVPDSIQTDLESMTGTGYYATKYRSEVGAYDESYKTTRDIMETLEHLEKNFGQVKYYLEQNHPNLLSTE